MRPCGAILIVGGDSLIGGELLRGLTAEGVQAIGTTHRPDGEGLFLELTAEREFILPDGVKAAVIAAGPTGFVVCERNAEAERINTVHVPALVKRLLKAGVFTVYLSSSAVFSADRHRPAEDAPPEPTTAYGRHKASAERQIMGIAAALGAPELACVVRLTKVVDAHRLPIATWVADWRSGRSTCAFSDVRTSPITLGYVGEALRAVLAGRLGGIWHLSGWEGISYAGLCAGLAAELGVPDTCIEVATSDEAGVTAPFKPVDGALAMSETARMIGLAAQPLAMVFRELRNQIGKMTHDSS